MILIADSGATKTDWCICKSYADYQIIQTEGINPFHQSEEKIRSILEVQLLPSLLPHLPEIQTVFFYGSGCTPSRSESVRKTLIHYFPSRPVIVESDLLGAAHALYKNSPGIACILGTGSNSCLYDGKQIIQNTSPLGYILGDEGSGAYLGKRFVGDCLKAQLPPSLCNGLLEELNLTVPELLDKVYRQPQANRFLASITPYIYKNKTQPEVQLFLKDCFAEFFRRNILTYKSKLPVSFVGSVAWFFQEEIKESAKAMNLTTGLFVRNPIKELINYHLLY